MNVRPDQLPRVAGRQDSTRTFCSFLLNLKSGQSYYVEGDQVRELMCLVLFLRLHRSHLRSPSVRDPDEFDPDQWIIQLG